jgi:pyruvate dehydrogenase E1 component alpha subunit
VITPVIVPDLGATGGDVRVARWLVGEGEFVAAGQLLLSLETDKATQDVEAFRSGYLRQILAPAETVVAQGDVIALLADAADEALAGAAAASSAMLSRPTSPRPVIPPGVGRESMPPPAPLLLSADTPPTPQQLLTLYRRMVLIRRYEDHLYRLFLQGQVPGTLHQCQGQEAVAVGVCAALRSDDVIFSTHRPVGHLLAKGASPRAISAEIWGKATGCAGGKGGQMHLAAVEVGAMPANAIVGANVPIAVGAALAFRLRREDRVAVSFFGDGAVNIGAWHEGVNLAAVKDAPVVFVCENNLYAASTHVSHSLRVAAIADRAAAYGIPGRSVDGMDVLAVHESAAQAMARARSGRGPTLLEYRTYRFKGHSRGDPGGYRSREEFEEWSRRDPVELFRRRLIGEFGQGERELDEIERACQAEVEEAVAFAVASPEPAAAEGLRHVFAEDGR